MNPDDWMINQRPSNPHVDLFVAWIVYLVGGVAIFGSFAGWW